ncbi:MAG TPA: hypothetical protein VFV33_03085, partial [Gemmatimonadaceae bacterium]|nr:hypothetical protein [Gemmatimonadaceae bacterium]
MTPSLIPSPASPRTASPRTAPAARVAVRPVARTDADAWCTLRTALWPEGSADEHALEIARFFWSADDPVACLVAESAGQVI